MLQVFFCNSATGVFNCNCDRAWFFIETDTDLATGWCELEGIADQVLKYPLHQPDIRIYDAGIIGRLYGQVHITFFSIQTKIMDCIMQQFCQ